MRRSTESAIEDYVEETYAMGEPSVPLEKALSVAAALENDETLRRLAMRATLVSCDTDFARFDGLKWMNPLKSG